MNDLAFQASHHLAHGDDLATLAERLAHTPMSAIGEGSGHLGFPDLLARSTLKRLDAWFDEVRRAQWPNMAALKQLYRTASVVSADRVVFNIKGNDYRLVTAMDFEKRIVWIKWIGTHSEYDRIDVKTVAYERPKADSK